MANKKQYVLAVPNFSEGRDTKVVNEIVDAVRGIEGVKVVSVEPEADFNRTVVTMIGEPASIKKALVALGKSANQHIDMTKQSGSHPRIGAEDSLPVFPLSNITMDECVALAKEVGQEYFKETGVPVYFCGDCASNDDRKAYAYVRKGQYEGLGQLLKEARDDPARKAEYDARKPDLSRDGLLDAKSGATICSAEKTGLTAYNIFLDTEDVSVAKAVAKTVRGPSGGFSCIRAVGIKFPEHKGVVVSMNMFDCVNLPITRLFNFVKTEAARFGVNVTGSQLVGPLKLEAILSAFAYSVGLEDFDNSQILEWHLMDM
ncbi:MAG: glutamate formimidoyltransferase [Oscillibacter sp.]|jgi:glutamate formiminotransferase|nr:glutamate formimidoyltransferase [Oscillibacter sp.]